MYRMRSTLVLLSLCGVSVAFHAQNVRQATSTELQRNHVGVTLPSTAPFRPLVLRASDGDSDASSPKKSSKMSKRKKTSKGPRKPRDEEPAQTKEELVRAVGEQMMRRKNQEQTPAKPEVGSNLFDKLNPFKYGQAVRQTIDTALTSIAISPERKSLYIDDRISELVGASFTERNSLMERLGQDDFIPEVLVVGATGEVGRLVVRRLLLDGRFRVRVLVRNLYTKTLNLLGTGVTYCQGDLGNMNSLEYALTDVDKIVFCASAPRPDEDQFQKKFEDFYKETFEADAAADVDALKDEEPEKSQVDIEWDRLESVLEVRARLAEQVDCIGMANLVRAYQDVRHVDYGTSQAAKRSLFKFQDRPEDFNLFAIDEEEDNDTAVGGDEPSADSKVSDNAEVYAEYDDEEEDGDSDGDEGDDDYDQYDDYADYDEEYAGSEVEERRDTSVQTQVQWIQNKFEHGVFVGRVPKSTDGKNGGEASIVSSRFRSRDDPGSGIDLGGGFAGFVCRVCSDGGTYEAFVRTGAYYDDGIEYVCQFSTSTKPTGRNRSPNRFTTVRLPFESFKPIRRKSVEGTSDTESIPAFRGLDVRNIGFRYRSVNNPDKSRLEQQDDFVSFYLAICYIKLYRSQPEPEFVYVSDARIPPVVADGMVSHNLKQLNVANTEGSVSLLDETTLKTATKDNTARIEQETYYKFRGEEILKSSGLSYAVVRVLDLNDSPTGEASTIDLKSTNADVVSVSRAEVAQVCVSALLNPAALNKSFYISKKSGQKSTSADDEDFASQFSQLPVDAIR